MEDLRSMAFFPGEVQFIPDMVTLFEIRSSTKFASMFDDIKGPMGIAIRF